MVSAAGLVVEIFAEEGDFLSSGRATFVLFASGMPSGLDHLADRNGQIFARINPAMLDTFLAERNPPLLTDDHAPIDRLVGIGEL